MKLKALTETTKWDIPNHTYLIDPATEKLVGYIKEGCKRVKWFKKPLFFDKRRRSFKISTWSK